MSEPGAPRFRVCVFCGSNAGAEPLYADAVKELAAELVKRKIGLVYGGANAGLMGALADGVLAANGSVIGVIPEALLIKEVAHTGLTELRKVATMHERKKTMFDLSDAFLALPGGFGTLDETFEILTWMQLGLHQKPLIFLNINGFFTPLLEYFDKAVAAGFIKPQHRGLFSVASSPKEAMERLPAR